MRGVSQEKVSEGDEKGGKVLGREISLYKGTEVQRTSLRNLM